MAEQHEVIGIIDCFHGYVSTHTSNGVGHALNVINGHSIIHFACDDQDRPVLPNALENPSSAKPFDQTRETETLMT